MQEIFTVFSFPIMIQPSQMQLHELKSIPLLGTLIFLWCLTKSLAFNPSVCVEYTLVSWTGNIYCLPLIKCCYFAYTWSWCNVICSKVYWCQHSFMSFKLWHPEDCWWKLCGPCNSYTDESWCYQSRYQGNCWPSGHIPI